MDKSKFYVHTLLRMIVYGKSSFPKCFDFANEMTVNRVKL